MLCAPSSPAIWRAHNKFWRRVNKKFDSTVLPPPGGDYQRQQDDPVTKAFIAYLRTEPLLKGILTGHLHFTIQERFSPTAMQYVIGGNFMFHGEEITFS